MSDSKEEDVHVNDILSTKNDQTLNHAETDYKAPDFHNTQHASKITPLQEQSMDNAPIANTPRHDISSTQQDSSHLHKQQNTSTLFSHPYHKTTSQDGTTTVSHSGDAPAIEPQHDVPSEHADTPTTTMTSKDSSEIESPEDPLDISTNKHSNNNNPGESKDSAGHTDIPHVLSTRDTPASQDDKDDKENTPQMNTPNDNNNNSSSSDFFSSFTSRLKSTFYHANDAITTGLNAAMKKVDQVLDDRPSVTPEQLSKEYDALYTGPTTNDIIFGDGVSGDGSHPSRPSQQSLDRQHPRDGNGNDAPLSTRSSTNSRQQEQSTTVKAKSVSHGAVHPQSAAQEGDVTSPRTVTSYIDHYQTLVAVLGSLLQCGWCGEPFQGDIITIPCGHSYCRSCLTSMETVFTSPLAAAPPPSHQTGYSGPEALQDIPLTTTTSHSSSNIKNETTVAPTFTTSDSSSSSLVAPTAAGTTKAENMSIECVVCSAQHSIEVIRTCKPAEILTIMNRILTEQYEFLSTLPQLEDTAEDVIGTGKGVAREQASGSGAKSKVSGSTNIVPTPKRVTPTPTPTPTSRSITPSNRGMATDASSSAPRSTSTSIHPLVADHVQSYRRRSSQLSSQSLEDIRQMDDPPHVYDDNEKHGLVPSHDDHVDVVLHDVDLRMSQHRLSAGSGGDGADILSPKGQPHQKQGQANTHGEMAQEHRSQSNEDDPSSSTSSSTTATTTAATTSWLDSFLSKGMEKTLRGLHIAQDAVTDSVGRLIDTYQQPKSTTPQHTPTNLSSREQRPPGDKTIANADAYEMIDMSDRASFGLYEPQYDADAGHRDGRVSYSGYGDDDDHEEDIDVTLDLDINPSISPYHEHRMSYQHLGTVDGDSTASAPPAPPQGRDYTAPLTLLDVTDTTPFLEDSLFALESPSPPDSVTSPIHDDNIQEKGPSIPIEKSANGLDDIT